MYLYLIMVDKRWGSMYKDQGQVLEYNDAEDADVVLVLEGHREMVLVIL